MDQYPVGTLLDSSGNPFSNHLPDLYNQRPPSPPGATLDNGYGPTTIIVESGAGRIELTESRNATRTISYADIYATQPAVGAAVNKLYRAIATLPLKVYERPARGKSQNGKAMHPEDVSEDPDNTLAQLIHCPAPGYGEVSLKEWLCLPYLVHGNSLVAKFRGNGYGSPPTTILPLDWRFLQAWARIGAPVLVWATVQTGVMRWIAPSETIYTAWTSPAGSNGAWLGTSPLQQLGVTIKIDEAAQRFAASSLRNGARPSGIVTLPPPPLGPNIEQAPEATTVLQKALAGSYAGVDEAMKIAVLGGGAEWHEWGANAQEAQLIETRQWDRDEILMMYDVLGQLRTNSDGGTNLPEEDARLFRTVLPPHLVMMADRLNAQLVRPEPEWANFFVKYHLDEAVWSDPALLSDKMVNEVNAGLRTRQEGRKPLGLPPATNPYADELIVSTSSEGILGTLPGSLSIGEEEREMVMSDPGTEGVPAPPLEKIDSTLTPEGEGG